MLTVEAPDSFVVGSWAVLRIKLGTLETLARVPRPRPATDCPHGRRNCAGAGGRLVRHAVNPLSANFMAPVVGTSQMPQRPR
jgi:hypothetical protein